MNSNAQFTYTLLSSGAAGHAAGAAERALGRDDGLGQRLGDGFEALRQDLEYLLRLVAVALRFESDALLESHLSWLKVVHHGRGVPERDLQLLVECLRDEVGERLPPASAPLAEGLLGRCLERLAELPSEPPSVLDGPLEAADEVRRLLVSVLEGKKEAALAEVRGALEAGRSAESVYRDIMQPAQAEIGRLWQMGELHVGEEHVATELMRHLVYAVRSLAPVPASGIGRRALVGSASGDLHDLASSIVGDCLERAGFEVLGLGASVPAPDLALAAVDFQADLVALSAHLADQIPAVEEAIATFRRLPELAGRPILVGGPALVLDPRLWERIGADGFARDSVELGPVALRLVGAA